jgi:alkylation response protein AidB-like acyl-CoA dehydrogenase
LRALRLSRVQSIFGGTTEIMKEIVGRAWACNPDQALYEANALGS